ncbi:MAG: hypothetical protein ACRC28_03120 [Clostridium sp.]|uniref:hypothetical protein n=1 Tax=Clostridium sp. TaxID=1506 RepID=UPI003F3CE75A
MFGKIIDLTDMEAYVLLSDDSIYKLPISKISTLSINDTIFIPAFVNTSCHSYVNTTNNLI